MLSREFNIIPYFAPCICFALVLASKIFKNLNLSDSMPVRTELINNFFEKKSQMQMAAFLK